MVQFQCVKNQNEYILMKVKNVKVVIIVLAILITSSFVFLVLAKEKSTTDNNIVLDSDQDGLTNVEEKLYGTNPYNADTDGDGYSDGTEIKSGYNPLKSAPNDKLSTHLDKKNKTTNGKEINTNNTGQNNLTQQVAQKIFQLSNQNGSSDKNVSLQQIKDVVDQSLNSSTGLDVLTSKISKKDIKIKKENFSHLNKKEIKEKKKEDFIDYITAVFYILASNSPEPITNSSSMTSITSKMVKKITDALVTRDTKPIKDISESGKKMLIQLKKLEVPEDLVDIDLKALQFAEYAQNMKQYIKPTGDPLEDIANFSRMSGLVENLMSFSQDVQVKFSQYDIKYNKDIENKLNDYGFNVEKNTLIKSIINNSSVKK